MGSSTADNLDQNRRLPPPGGGVPCADGVRAVDERRARRAERARGARTWLNQARFSEEGVCSVGLFGGLGQHPRTGSSVVPAREPGGPSELAGGLTVSSRRTYRGGCRCRLACPDSSTIVNRDPRPGPALRCEIGAARLHPWDPRHPHPLRGPGASRRRGPPIMRAGGASTIPEGAALGGTAAARPCWTRHPEYRRPG